MKRTKEIGVTRRYIGGSGVATLLGCGGTNPMKGVHGGDASGAWGGYIPITRGIYRAKQINGVKDQGGMGGTHGGCGGDASPPSPPVATGP